MNCPAISQGVPEGTAQPRDKLTTSRSSQCPAYKGFEVVRQFRMRFGLQDFIDQNLNEALKISRFLAAELASTNLRSND